MIEAFHLLTVAFAGRVVSLCLHGQAIFQLRERRDSSHTVGEGSNHTRSRPEYINHHNRPFCHWILMHQVRREADVDEFHLRHYTNGSFATSAFKDLPRTSIKIGEPGAA